MNSKELPIEEFNEVCVSSVLQFNDDRTFEVYKMTNLLSGKPIEYLEYKKLLIKEVKEIDVVKVKKDTDKALNKFINSLKKGGK